ncbi:mannosyl-oligosaccharide alpha-1,2-mannosidase, putative [Talaromyces stipitatus ATCC 10500]|uniref:alpha-1,2-Mannosidase n=1 Tax=Talaromyces stipitatus (strain ATCC 10500 / CBS 375.48 / QM 6759 / NRRL 1006) TaxID=441959 RepID=B8MAV1_TALSN|nr:mannosyl-oligosaccharide alpha-1,2-mannosidase, putative [Talaromyces stipitatus ATCC 10500]EED17791.1 mannosyl-oligosaccharide alpha-1,2-mannosidase, putative [Talaromyces stipitatus ATCC 10500]
MRASDEVKPLSGQAHDPFGGWAATLVDTLGASSLQSLLIAMSYTLTPAQIQLDTLWMMGLHDEFKEAVLAIAELNFTTCTLDEVNVFETTIRYLGGLLGAYDISKGQYPVLLQKAIEVGQMLYAAFDTPNRMPVTRWKFHDAVNNLPQEAGENVLVAEIGSLTLEFTRLSQITKDPRWFDAVQRIMNIFDDQQEMTKVPGLWPVVVSAKTKNFHEFSGFTIGGMADSLYEYLPKQHLLLSGGSQQYRKSYSGAIAAMKSHIFFRPMTEDGRHVLFPGDVSWNGNEPTIEAKAQHLSCFAGGMVALGAQAFGRPEELTVARRLVDGCIWGYESGVSGIMPEIIRPVACEDQNSCPWDEDKWHRGVEEQYPEESAETTIKARHLPPGVSKIDDGRYILRITGDPVLQEKAWNMFNNIIKHTITDIAHAGLSDRTVPNPPKARPDGVFLDCGDLEIFLFDFLGARCCKFR